MVKLCTRCNTTKSVFEFSKNISTKDGLQAYCKPCKYQIDTEYRHNNKDKINAYYRQYREEHSSHYIYLIYKEEEIIYIGSCSSLHRLYNHCNGHSHIADKIKGIWTSIKYIDIGEYLNSKLEREYIESLFIEEIEPNLNKKMNIKIDDTIREEELSILAYDFMDHIDEIFATFKENTDIYNMYYIDENSIEEYAEDISSIVAFYTGKEDEEDEWE